MIGRQEGQHHLERHETLGSCSPVWQERVSWMIGSIPHHKCQYQGARHQRSTSAKGAGNTAKHTQVYRAQPYEQGLGKKKWNAVCHLFNWAPAVCHLFNWAPAGCPYGEDCIFAYRCTKCRRKDHGRRSFSVPNTREERGSLLQPCL